MSRVALSLCALALAFLPACSFHSVARDWNGRVGPQGEPLYFSSVTKVGMNLFIIIPLFGNVQIDGMVDELTSEIGELGGDHVTIVQGATENYWYGFSPLTWIFTPIISDLSATYRPTPSALKRDMEAGQVTPPPARDPEAEAAAEGDTSSETADHEADETDETVGEMP